MLCQNFAPTATAPPEAPITTGSAASAGRTCGSPAAPRDRDRLEPAHAEPRQRYGRAARDPCDRQREPAAGRRGPAGRRESAHLAEQHPTTTPTASKLCRGRRRRTTRRGPPERREQLVGPPLHAAGEQHGPADLAGVEPAGAGEPGERRPEVAIRRASARRSGSTISSAVDFYRSAGARSRSRGGQFPNIQAPQPVRTPAPRSTSQRRPRGERGAGSDHADRDGHRTTSALRRDVP